jgi:hypothetical protein
MNRVQFAVLSHSGARRQRVALRIACALGALLLAAHDADAACGCPGGGVPLIKSASLRGNDLNEVRGHCAPPGARVEVQVSQQHIRPEEVCPPRCPTDDIYTYCINQCSWISVGQTTADATGSFVLADIDHYQSVQLIASQPSQGYGLDGVYTQIRVVTRDPATGRWSQPTNPPYLESFNLGWPGYEGGFAFVETRVSGASQMHAMVADGPDDGTIPSIALDVDEDTPNGWLSQHPNGTVEYTRYGICDPSQGCPSNWLISQSPSINVQAPPLGRGSEFPYVLGMVTAAKPGAMFIATNILGPRGIPDIGVEVNVDVQVHVDLGFLFLGLL